MGLLILVDSREQKPYTFKDNLCDVRESTLVTGDYSVEHLEDYITIERKELSDIIGCITKGRKRFKAELHRMQSYKGKAVIIEADFQDIVSGNYRSKVKPYSVLSSIAAWTTEYNVPFIFAGNRKNAEDMTYYILKNFHLRMQKFCQKLIIKELK